MRITLMDGHNMTGPTPAKSDRVEKEPSHAERAVRNAQESKVRATSDWVDGHIDNKKHTEIHKRADRVLATGGKIMGSFDGGENEADADKRPKAGRKLASSTGKAPGLKKPGPRKGERI